MELTLDIYKAMCGTKTFTINGIDADEFDFGEGSDEDPDLEEEYSCGNRVFRCKKPTQIVLDKYKINIDEYNEICDQLEEKLSFGSCGWCA